MPFSNFPLASHLAPSMSGLPAIAIRWEMLAFEMGTRLVRSPDRALAAISFEPAALHPIIFATCGEREPKVDKTPPSTAGAEISGRVRRALIALARLLARQAARAADKKVDRGGDR